MCSNIGLSMIQRRISSFATLSPTPPDRVTRDVRRLNQPCANKVGSRPSRRRKKKNKNHRKRKTTSTATPKQCRTVQRIRHKHKRGRRNDLTKLMKKAENKEKRRNGRRLKRQWRARYRHMALSGSSHRARDVRLKFFELHNAHSEDSYKTEQEQMSNEQKHSQNNRNFKDVNMKIASFNAKGLFCGRGLLR